jgi:hypothetical protein
MNGIVQGGWPFVWVAYIVTVIFLGGYCAVTLRAAVRPVTGQK